MVFIRKLGHKVIGIDNFDGFYPVEFKQLNLADLRGNSKFQFHQADIRDSNALKAIFSSDKIDAVIHLAAKAGVRPSIDSITEYYDVNVNCSVTYWKP